MFIKVRSPFFFFDYYYLLTQKLFWFLIFRNTEWVIGVVIYTGHETKSMLNNKRVRAKRSQLEKDLNDIVLWLIILLIIMCLICGFGTACNFLLFFLLTLILHNTLFFKFYFFLSKKK